MEVTIVGCSGSFAGPDSPASCYLLRAEFEGRTWSIVLDLGNGALGNLQRHIDPLTLDAVLISHLHVDHFIDLCGLYVMLKYVPGGSGGSTSNARWLVPSWSELGGGGGAAHSGVARYSA